MMAIIALVISGFTLLGLALSTVAPLLFFGVVALGLGAGFGDVIDDGELASSSASYSGGEVTPAARQRRRVDPGHRGGRPRGGRRVGRPGHL